jgi:hypothetical protein
VHINAPKLPQRSYAGLLEYMPVCNKNLLQKDCCNLYGVLSAMAAVEVFRWQGLD